MALFAEIEANQAKLDQCHKLSQQYSTAVKDYELQLMTYRVFVETQQKSPVKRRRVLSSSDAITQEFMDLQTRYTALVTLTTQHVKYISDALRRLEEEEFGDSQQLRLVRILRSTVMVRVGGGWMALDEFLVKNYPCRVHHPGSKIKRSDSSSSIASPESSATGGQSGSRRGLAKPSKIPTMSKKTTTAKTPGPKR